jgi:hypothetical protein
MLNISGSCHFFCNYFLRMVCNLRRAGTGRWLDQRHLKWTGTNLRLWLANEVVGPFESWPGKEMLGRYVSGLRFELMQSHYIQRVTEAAGAGIHPASPSPLAAQSIPASPLEPLFRNVGPCESGLNSRFGKRPPAYRNRGALPRCTW